MMELFTKEGACKLVEACTYPITGGGCVSRVYTDHGVFEVGPEGGWIVELTDDRSLYLDAISPPVDRFAGSLGPCCRRAANRGPA